MGDVVNLISGMEKDVCDGMAAMNRCLAAGEAERRERNCVMNVRAGRMLGGRCARKLPVS